MTIVMENFRIFIHGSNRFIDFILVPDKACLAAFYKRFSRKFKKKIPPEKVGGFFLSHRHKPGTIFLSRDLLGAGIVAHEVCHAVFHHFRQRGLDPRKNEERFCSIAGRLNNAFWKKYQQHHWPEDLMIVEKNAKLRPLKERK